jgi:hypothetical protein
MSEETPGAAMVTPTRLLAIAIVCWLWVMTTSCVPLIDVFSSSR